jgi:integrase
MARYLLDSRADSTVSKYYGAFLRWDRFITMQGSRSIPAQPVEVALYLTHLLDNAMTYHSVSSAMHGIKWAHDMNGLEDSTKNSFVVNLLEASKRIARPPKVKKEPVTKDMLIALCEKYEDNTDLLIVRDLTIILLCFSGFLRYDEVSSLRCCDVNFDSEFFTLNIDKSKTDQYRKGNEIVVSKGVTTACPFLMLHKYMSIARVDSQSSKYLFRPIFRSKGTVSLVYKDRKLSYTSARECVISRLKEVSAGINLGLHSLRAGGATEAANSDVNERCWKRHGRWRSDSAKDGYIEDSLSKRLSVSQSLGL